MIGEGCARLMHELNMNDYSTSIGMYEVAFEYACSRTVYFLLYFAGYVVGDSIFRFHFYALCIYEVAVAFR